MDRPQLPEPRNLILARPETNPSAGPLRPVTVTDLGGILARRGWVGVLVVAISLATAYVVAHRTPPRWQATADLLLVQRALQTSSAASTAYIQPMGESIETQVAMLQSPSTFEHAVDKLRNDALAAGMSPDSVTITPEQMQASTTVGAISGTQLVAVTVAATGRGVALTYAGAICQSFVEWKNDLSRHSVEEALRKLEERARAAALQLNDAERQETLFKQQHNMVDVSAQQKQLLENFLTEDNAVTSMQQDMLSQQKHLASLKSLLAQANEAIRQGVAQGTGVRDDTMALSLQTQINQLEIQRGQMALRYTIAFPGKLKDMDAQISDLQKRLIRVTSTAVDPRTPSFVVQNSLLEQCRSVQDSITLLQDKIAAAIQERAKLKAQVDVMPAATLEYARIAQNTDIAKSISDSLQASLNAVRADKDLATGNVEIAQDPYALVNPFEPNYTRDLTYGGAIGLVLAFLAMVVLEQADRRVRDMVMLRALATGPVLGGIPKLNHYQVREVKAFRTPPDVMEAFSRARANLAVAMGSLRRRNVDIGKVVLVCSVAPGEGKSLTAAELSRSLARAGSSVILVDADIRKPSQNRLFGTSEPIGIAQVLEGDVPLSDALVASDIPNLSILYSGYTDRNPTDLLWSSDVHGLLDTLRTEADVIIVDTPACAVVADAVVLARYADGVIFVVGASQVDRDAVRLNSESLSAAGCGTMTFLMNRAPKDAAGTYRGYYYTRPRPRPGAGIGPSNGNGSLRSVLSAAAEPTLSESDSQPQVDATGPE